jgi:hypothetical protein
MKRAAMLIAVVLCICAWAADNAVVTTRAISNRKSAIASGADAVTIPHLLSYQGQVTDTAGRPVPNNVYAITFRIFDQDTGGVEYWSELQNVTTKDGRFSCLLGSVTPLDYLPQEGSCWLQMQVHPDPAMTPRIRIASAAYAFMADVANSADSARPNGYASGDLTGYYPSPTIGTGKVNSNKILDRGVRGVDISVPCSLASLAGRVPISLSAPSANRALEVDTSLMTGIYVSGAVSYGFYANNCEYGVYSKGSTAGGYFSANIATGVGLIANAFNAVATDTAIHAHGKGIASGGWSTGFKDGSEAPGIVSAERTIIASGSARLIAGSAEIKLPEIFTKHIRSDVPVRLNVTPTADAPGLLVAERRGSAGFSVRLRRIATLAGSEDASFDWIAVGVLEEPSSEPVPGPEDKEER